MGAFSLHLGAIYTVSCTVFYNSFSLSPPHSSNSYRTKNSSPSLSSLPSCPPPPSLHEILAISWHSLWALVFILFYFLKNLWCWRRKEIFWWRKMLNSKVLSSFKVRFIFYSLVFTLRCMIRFWLCSGFTLCTQLAAAKHHTVSQQECLDSCMHQVSAF